MSWVWRFNQQMTQATIFYNQKKTGIEAWNRADLHKKFTLVVKQAATSARTAHNVDVGEVTLTNSTDKYFELLKYVS